MWRLVWKNLLRNKRRSFLTGSSVAVSLFLLSSLAIVYTALGSPLQHGDAIPIMMVHRAAGIVLPMRAGSRSRIAVVPGVVAISSLTWFGGYWKDPSDQFGNFAVDADTIFDVQAASKIAPEQLAAFKGERTAAVAGKRLADKHQWKIGDRITLLGSVWGATPELTLRGIFTGGPEDQFWFHWNYLNEAMGRPNIVGMYFIRIDQAENAARIGQAVDKLFRNTDNETKTESLNAFLLSFVSLLGNVRLIILAIGSAVGFAILLIVANSMGMSIRERTAEAAVLRSLGFRAGHILRLFLGESLLVTMAGALLGVGGATLLYDSLALSQIGQFVFADMRMRPDTLAFCMAVAVIVGLAAAGLPAYRAAKTNIAEALRYVG